MSTTTGKTEQVSCSEIVASIEKQASEGVRFPVSEATKLEQQLQICLQQRKITQAEYNALIELMKTR